MLDVVMPFNQPASLPFYHPHMHMAANPIVDEIDLLNNPSSLYLTHFLPPSTDHLHLPADWHQPALSRDATVPNPSETIWGNPSPFGTMGQSIRTTEDDEFGLDSTVTLPSISRPRRRGRTLRSFASNSPTTTRMHRHPVNISRDARDRSPRHIALSSSPTGYPIDPHKPSYHQHPQHPDSLYAHGPSAAKRRRLDAHTPPQVVTPNRPLQSPTHSNDSYTAQQLHHHHHIHAQPAPPLQHHARHSDYYSPPSWHPISGTHHASSSSPTWPSHHHQTFYAAGPPQHHGPSPMIPLHLHQPPTMPYPNAPSPTSSAPIPPPEYRATSAQPSYTESSWRSAESVAVPENDVHHPLSEFPPKPYKDGPNAISPWWPLKVVGKIYGSRLEQMPAIESRLARLEDNVDRYIDSRCEQALRNSQLPGVPFDPPPVQTKPKGPSRIFGGRIWPTALARRVKRNQRDRDA